MRRAARSGPVACMTVRLKMTLKDDAQKGLFRAQRADGVEGEDAQRMMCGVGTQLTLWKVTILRDSVRDAVKDDDGQRTLDDVGTQWTLKATMHRRTAQALAISARHAPDLGISSSPLSTGWNKNKYSIFNEVFS